MAAPPKISAAQMRAEQQAKAVKYADFIKTVADSSGNALTLQLERKLQEALEDFRPQPNVNSTVPIEGIDPLDRQSAANRIREMVATNFGPPRNFTVVFGGDTDPVTKLQINVSARLTWGTP